MTAMGPLFFSFRTEIFTYFLLVPSFVQRVSKQTSSTQSPVAVVYDKSNNKADNWSSPLLEGSYFYLAFVSLSVCVC